MIVIETGSVRDFMRAIVPTEAHFAGPPVIFRGQGDATWDLRPSLWRSDSWEALGGAARHGLRVVGKLVEDGSSGVVDAGQSLLRTLGVVLHRGGLGPHALAGPSVEALAQHIGLPTRLLDWTRSPLFAAYFAAVHALRANPTGGRLVVYAMSSLYLENSRRLESLDKPDVGGLGNPNLVAQHGRFICVDCDPPDLLAGVVRRVVPLGVPLGLVGCHEVDNHFAAITLAQEHTPALLRVLRDQGVHGAALFPGHIGVAELVREVFRS